MSQIKCERCSYREDCRVARSGNCLPDLIDELPEFWRYYYRGKPEMREVATDLILGGFRSVRRDDYSPDFRRRTPDLRWHSIHEAVSESNANMNRVGLPDRPIQLIEHEGKYYVGDDGHRRVSISKLLRIPTLNVLVTSLKPFRERKITVPKKKRKLSEVARRVT